MIFPGRFAFVLTLPVLAVLMGLPGSVRAHDPGLSTLRIEVRSADLLFHATLSPVDGAHLLAPDVRHEPFAANRLAYVARVPQLYAVEVDGTSLTAPDDVDVELLPGDNLEFRFRYLRPTGSRLTLNARLLASLPGGHRQYVTLVTSDGVLLAEKLWAAHEAEMSVVLPPGSAGGAGAVGRSGDSGVTASPAGAGATERVSGDRTAAFKAFLRLGVEHILTGYDHLLFLLGVLLVCRGWGSLLAVITSFTLGHSLTLIAATLDWATVSPAVIEPTIAATIVYVGVENLLRRGAEPRGRWLLTFGFGLIHGFGFAGMLRELGVGSDGRGLLVPLFSFNLGVELGQLLIAAVILPLLWWAHRFPLFGRRGVPALSVLVGAVGLYWLLERTVWA